MWAEPPAWVTVSQWPKMLFFQSVLLLPWVSPPYCDLWCVFPVSLLPALQVRTVQTPIAFITSHQCWYLVTRHTGCNGLWQAVEVELVAMGTAGLWSDECFYVPILIKPSRRITSFFYHQWSHASLSSIKPCRLFFSFKIWVGTVYACLPISNCVFSLIANSTIRFSLFRGSKTVCDNLFYLHFLPVIEYYLVLLLYILYSRILSLYFYLLNKTGSDSDSIAHFAQLC